MCQRRVILWSTAYADLLTEVAVGGIGVQMMYWAHAFAQNGWNVFSLYQKVKPELQDARRCVFEKEMETHFWNSGCYLFFALWLLLKIRPQVVICRGGRNRNLMYIAFLCRLFRIKLVQFLASDADLNYDFATHSWTVRLNSMFFRWGLKLTKYIVAQNDRQKEMAFNQFRRKNVIKIPNIWEQSEELNLSTKRGVILWVGNTRKLKRPQWFFEIAKKFPEEKFILIGGNSDLSVYEECCMRSIQSPNVEFLGGLPFDETSKWFAKAKVLICTSEYEGFPNTFLQAWANEIPVLSTVNPNEAITKYNLGYVCGTIEEFQNTLSILLSTEVYTNMQTAVKRYFHHTHSLQPNYEKLMEMLMR